MITIQTLMTFSEMRELSQIPHKTFVNIEPILTKEFGNVTVSDFVTIAGTNIFDSNFADLLFSELYIRFLDYKKTYGIPDTAKTKS